MDFSIVKEEDYPYPGFGQVDLKEFGFSEDYLTSPNSGFADDEFTQVFVRQVDIGEEELAVENDSGCYLDISQSYLDVSENYSDLSIQDCIANISFNVEEDPIDVMNDTDFHIVENEDFVCLDFSRRNSSFEMADTTPKRTFAVKSSSPICDNSAIFKFEMENNCSPILKIEKPNRNFKYEKQSDLNTSNKAALQYFNIDIKDIDKYYDNQGYCKLCNNKYFSSGSAKRHIKLSHLKLREFECRKCNINFQENKGLKEHLRRFHPEFEIVDLRDIKKEFRPMLVGGYVRGHVDLEAVKKDSCSFRQEKQCNNNSRKNRFGNGRKVKEIVLLECEHCDEKFSGTASLRNHVIKVHSLKESAAVVGKKPKKSSKTIKKRLTPKQKRENDPNFKENLNLLKSLILDLKSETTTSPQQQLSIKQEVLSNTTETEMILETSDINNTDGCIKLVPAPDNLLPVEEEPTAATPVPDLKQDKKKARVKKPKSIKNKKLKSKGGMTWPIICSKCKTVLTNVNDFNKHMLDHWAEDKSCGVCNKSSPKRGNFMTHIRRHSGERPFQCPACEMSFNQKSHLVKHMAKRCKNQDQVTTTTSSDVNNAQKRRKKMNLKKKADKKTKSSKKELKKKNQKK